MAKRARDMPASAAMSASAQSRVESACKATKALARRVSARPASVPPCVRPRSMQWRSRRIKSSSHSRSSAACRPHCSANAWSYSSSSKACAPGNSANGTNTRLGKESVIGLWPPPPNRIDAHTPSAPSRSSAISRCASGRGMNSKLGSVMLNVPLRPPMSLTGPRLTRYTCPRRVSRSKLCTPQICPEWKSPARSEKRCRKSVRRRTQVKPLIRNMALQSTHRFMMHPKRA